MDSRKHAIPTYTRMKHEGHLSALSRLAFSTYPSSEILALVLCKPGGDCRALLSESPPEYPGRFIFFSLEGYFWFIQEGALPLLIK